MTVGQQQQPGPVFAPEVAHDFLSGMFGGLPGLVQVCSVNDWVGGFFSTDPAGIAAAVTYAGQLDQAGAHSIYVRATTVTHRPEEGRGGADITCAVPMVWADVDYGTEGHKPGKGAPLPPDQDAAVRVIAESGLPQPSLLVHSGGGLYPLWRLDAPGAGTGSARNAAASATTRPAPTTTKPWSTSP